MTMTTTSNAPLILLVDDEPSFLETISELLRHGGYRTVTASRGEEALGILSRNAESISLAILDIRMPDMDGLDTLDRIVRFHPSLPVIMLTGENAIDMVVRAMKGGATNYVYKGAKGEELLAAVRSALEGSVRTPSTSDRENTQFERHGVVGRSKALAQLLSKAEMCARSTISVLITGETGVGKDLLARVIHSMSPRNNNSLVVVDVPNIPATMFESELFGHTKGAFTGAAESKTGLVQTADSSTLFLDEIGDFPIELQPKLLRVLDTKTVRRLGAVTTEQVDVRVVSATNCNLLEAVKERKFREDLLYRLRGIELHVPPLRERVEDIGPLAAHFLQIFLEESSLEPKRFTEAAIDLLERQRWPGNVRELRRAVEAVAVMTEGERIEHTDVARVLDQTVVAGGGATAQENVRSYDDVQMLARQTKKEELMKVLDRNGWNITRAAAELDIDRSTLSKQMKSLGIKKPRLQL